MDMKANLISDDELEQVNAGVNYSSGGWTAKVIVSNLKVQDRFGNVMVNKGSPLSLHGGDVVTILREHNNGTCQVDISHVPGGKGKEGFVSSHYLQFID